MKEWEGEVLQEVDYLIRVANKGVYPNTREEWLEVARHYQVDLRFLRAEGSRAVCFGSIIVVKEHDVDKLVMSRIRHEFTEFLLRSENAPPFNYQPSMPHANHCHRLAILNENIGN